MCEEVARGKEKKGRPEDESGLQEKRTPGGVGAIHDLVCAILGQVQCEEARVGEGERRVPAAQALYLELPLLKSECLRVFKGLECVFKGVGLGRRRLHTSRKSMLNPPPPPRLPASQTSQCEPAVGRRFLPHTNCTKFLLSSSSKVSANTRQNLRITCFGCVTGVGD